MADALDYKKIPTHVAIIMDGNGRWAKQKGWERTRGHEKGAQMVHEIIEEAVRLGIKYLTLYTFSTENWKRPEKEVMALMSLLIDHLEEETFQKNDVRFMTIGQIEKLPREVYDKVMECREHTKDNKKMTMVLALSYSSRQETAQALRQIAQSVQSGRLNIDDINEDTLSSYLETAFMPDPDLLIRTGGEVRLSNFLLHQSAYTELYFTDTFWPDFTPECLREAILSFQNRQRRYGKTSEQVLTDSKE